jgi:hypothetical protein
MSSRALGLALAICAACHGRTAAPRERVLARIPAGAQIVVAADGSALAVPRMRAAIDVLRPRWPQSFGCVIDAAIAGDHVALGITAARDMTVVIATRAAVTCPGLSKLEDGLWAATLGSGKPVIEDSVLDDAAHARARPYLETAPIAASIVLPGLKVLASASADPFEAWIAIDTFEAASALVEQKVRGVVDRLAHTEATSALAQHIEVTHDGSQVRAKLTGATDADLALAVRTALALYSAPAVRAAAGFACPQLAPPIIGCAGGTALTVTSLSSALEPLASAQVTPVIENERVAWLRLDTPITSLGLRAGDLVLAVDGRHLTSGAQLRELLLQARGATSITVQRNAVTVALDVTERSF